jgi:hypothetical protein
MEQNLPSETDSHTDGQINMKQLKYVVVFRFNLYFLSNLSCQMLHMSN